MPDPSQDVVRTARPQAIQRIAGSDDETIRPLPPGMRARLLEILAIGYACNCSQTRLGNAPDGAIAWQVQSMLDDFADYEAKRAWNLNDDHYEASKAVGAT